jgi:hypothetical protein
MSKRSAANIQYVVSELRKYFTLTQVPPPADFYGALKAYDDNKAAGASKQNIVNLWKMSYMSANQASAFVNAMEQIDGGHLIQDPNESPSWEEAYDRVLGPIVIKAGDLAKNISAELPWGRLMLVGALVYFGPVMLARFVKARK